jgi:hypothetical protein
MERGYNDDHQIGDEIVLTLPIKRLHPPGIHRRVSTLPARRWDEIALF